MTAAYPFSAVVGQDQLKLALLLNAVDPSIGGVLVRGHKGTAKSTTVRAMAALLPAVEVVDGDPFNRTVRELADPLPGSPDAPEGDRGPVRRPARLVELPVGASEDRLVGSLDLERALTRGQRHFEPGLLAAAHQGVLYVDEVNLLTDHLVDLLLDSAAMGVNHVEREGVSVRHPARFLLVGTMNPEEGELRPQLLDRFGLTVEVTAPGRARERTEVVRRRLRFDAAPGAFAASWQEAEHEVAARILAARRALADVVLDDAWLLRIAHVCSRFEVDGMRADIVIARTASAHAAWHGRDAVTRADVRAAALLALPHRRRRGPLEAPGLDEGALDTYLDEPLDPDDPEDPTDPDGPQAERDSQDGPDDAPGQADPSAGEAGDSASGQDRATAPRPTNDLTGDDEPHRDEAPDPAGGADAGEGEGADGPVTARPDEVHAIGTASAPPRLIVPGTGAGAWGRRSVATGPHGAVVGTTTDRRAGRGGDISTSQTLLAAAPHQQRRGRGDGPLRLVRDDLRHRVRQGREGNLVVFVVDASGSMGARARMTAVKGAVRSLLLDAYQRRDRIAMVTFRGSGAEVVLPPTSSVDVADRRLASLPTGGRTPLAAGLATALGVVRTEQVRDPDRRALAVVLTDGRANVGPAPRAEAERAAGALVAHGVAPVVIDTEQGFVRLGLAGALATAVGAPCWSLDDLGAASLADAVRRTTRASAA